MGKREKVEMLWWKSLVLGTAVSVGTAIVLLGLCAVLVSGGLLPERVGEGSVLLACAVGCLIGGRVTVRCKSEGTLLWGMVVGGAVAVVLAVSGVLLYGGLENGRCAAVSGACLCGGGLAGVVGGKKRKR